MYAIVNSYFQCTGERHIMNNIERLTAPSMELLIKEVDSTVNYQAKNGRAIKRVSYIGYNAVKKEYVLSVTFEPDYVEHGDHLVIITGNSKKQLKNARNSIVVWRCKQMMMKEKLIYEMQEFPAENLYAQVYVLQPA